MLNFKNTNIIFSIVFLILILLRINYTLPFLFFIILIIVYLTILFLGAKNVCSQFFLKSKCSSNDKSKIHLTFDDGPDVNTTPKILEVLKKHNHKATFFCIGHKIDKHPEIVKQIIEEGHKVGNHSFSHSNFFDFFGSKKIISEIIRTNKLIKEITGKDCNIFRPPFGITNPHIALSIKKLKMEVIAWNIRSLDTVKSKEKVLQRIKNAKNGDIILFHDTKKQTIEILDEFLRFK